MAITTQQFNKMFAKKKLRGLKESNGSVKEYIEELKQKMATKSDINKVLIAMNNFAKQLEDSKTRFAAQRRAFALKKKILR